MEFNIFLLSLFYYLANASSQGPKPNGGKVKSIPVVEALISRLEQGQWKPEDGGCLRATLDMLEGIRNNTLWATWVWDSMQLPAGSLSGVQTHTGNYDQCLQAPWSADERHPGLRSQYCAVEVRSPDAEQTKTFGPFDDTEEYYQTPTKDSSFNHHYFGACLPSICSPSSATKISQHLLRLTHLPDGHVFVDPRNCETAGEVLENPTGFYVFWTVVGILIITTIISTISTNDDTKQTALGTFTQWFCLKRNYRSLFTVSRNEVKVMHGMRFISAVVIVMIHEVYFAIQCSFDNELEVVKFMSSLFGLVCTHLEIVVDTYFAMSGLLLVRGLMMGKQKNVFCTLLKRYLRLIGSLALCVAYYLTTCDYMNRGPMWRTRVREESEVCGKYWWKSLLMANTDVASVCYDVTWYISCDFQLAILGTFLFYIFRRNRKLGLAAFVTVAVALTVNLGLTVYRKQLDILPFNYRATKFMRQHTELNYTYFSSPARAGPYLVGMVMGYIITTYKPAEYRNVIDKKWSACIATVSLLVASTMLGIGAIFAGRPYDPLESAVVVATNRVIWGTMICALIGVFEYGSLSLIPEFLSWPGFVPLSKLSYCIYLVHPIFFQLQKWSARSGATFSILNVFLNGCGVFVASSGCSIVLYLILEAPLANISNALFTEKSKPLEQNETKVDIRHNGNRTDTDRHEQNGHKYKLS